MQRIRPELFQTLINDWTLTDTGTIHELFRGVCKAIVFDSVPNQDQYFRLQIQEPGSKGAHQNWAIDPIYPGRKIIFDKPMEIILQTTIRDSLLVNYRTRIHVLDDYVEGIWATDPCEVMWYPLLRDLALPEAQAFSEEVEFYPVRSGYLRLRVEVGGVDFLFGVWSHDTVTPASYNLTGAGWVSNGSGEYSPDPQAGSQTMSRIPYLTKGVRYVFKFKNNDDASASTVAGVDVTTIHGSFPF